ncbi:MAG: DUF481 domain-containing protein [Gemmatimonadetes bacterium]|nr:DUF481 domain-containing protein [Gemmatimonadota bacterium]
MLRRVALAAALSCTSAGAPVLLAQTKPAKPVEASADLGFVNTTGNTEVTTLTANYKIVLNTGPWKLTHYFGTVYGKLRDSVNTSIWRTGVRGDRAFTERFGFFGLVNYDKNRFSGVAGRWEQGAGAQWKAIVETEDKLDVELGLSAIQQQAVTAVPDRNFASGRTALAYKHNFTDKAYFQQTAEYLANLQNGPDWRVNTESSLIAPLSEKFAIKLSFAIRYQNLPDPGFLATDRIFATAIQYTY